jgi:hypothetical protein
MKVVFMYFARGTDYQRHWLYFASLSTVTLAEGTFSNEAELRKLVGMSRNLVAGFIGYLRQLKTGYNSSFYFLAIKISRKKVQHDY